MLEGDISPPKVQSMQPQVIDRKAVRLIIDNGVVKATIAVACCIESKGAALAGVDGTAGVVNISYVPPESSRSPAANRQRVVYGKITLEP